MVAKRNQRKQAQKKSLPIGAMLISFAVGLFVMFLVHLKDSAPVEKTVTPPAKKVVKKDSNVIEPTFDFYTLLPEMEVVVDKPTQVKKRTIVSSPPQDARPRFADRYRRGARRPTAPVVCSNPRAGRRTRRQTPKRRGEAFVRGASHP